MLQSVVRKIGTVAISTTSYVYDGVGRVSTSIDGRDGATRFVYCTNAALPFSITLPPAMTGQAQEVFTGHYYPDGQLSNLVYADNTSVTYLQTPSSSGLGSLASGSRQYPTGLHYDEQVSLLTIDTP